MASLGTQVEAGARASNLGQGFIDDDRVMFGEPVDDHRIGHTDDERLAPVFEQRGVLEPLVIAVTVDLGLDASQNVVPNRSSHAERPDSPVSA